MAVVQSKIIKDWDKTGHLVADTMGLGNFEPPKGVVARIVLPGSTRTWDADVPAALAAAVVDADDFILDYVARPAMVARLHAEIVAALADLRASR